MKRTALSLFLCLPIVASASQGFRLDGTITEAGGAVGGSSSISLDDDTPLEFGDGTDCWFVYDSALTQFELNCTDVDGGGTDGVVWSVDDGTDDVDFTGQVNFAGGSISATLTIADSVSTVYGTSTDYYIKYNSSGAQWETWSTDVDGGGTDGLVWSVDDGTDDVDFTGDITVVGDATVNTINGNTVLNASGTPVDNQLAIWTGASTLEGDANLVWDGSRFDVTGPAYPAFVAERTTSGTTSIYSCAAFKLTSSGDMADTFGTGVNFLLEDTSGVENTLAGITVQRDGGDKFGTLSFRTSSGAAPIARMYVKSNGTVGIGTDSPSEELDIVGSLEVSGELVFDASSELSAPSDGNLLLTDTAGTDFGLLQFGGTTSSYPALKRNSTGLDLKLADDSAYTTLAVGGLTLNDDLNMGTNSINMAGIGGNNPVIEAVSDTVTFNRQNGTALATIQAREINSLTKLKMSTLTSPLQWPSGTQMDSGGLDGRFRIRDSGGTNGVCALISSNKWEAFQANCTSPVEIHGRFNTQEGATPTEPVTCDATNVGYWQVVRDTDAGASELCYCGHDGGAYDWRNSAGAACSFF